MAHLTLDMLKTSAHISLLVLLLLSVCLKKTWLILKVDLATELVKGLQLLVMRQVLTPAS